jgi:UDP-glucose 4-epimerase
VETPLLTHAACATGTLHVLDAARQAGVRRVVYAASSSAYGGASSEHGQTEDTPLKALSPYAAAKLAGELYMQAFTATYGLETVRLRFFNIFGPRQRADSPYSGVIALFIAAMSAGQAPIIHGDGLQSRDFTYVANAVQALMKAATAPKHVSGQVYNIGTGNSISVLELVQALNRILGTNLTAQHGPNRMGDVRFSKADITRTRCDLSYAPDVSFEEGLARTVRWYRESQMPPSAAR